MSALYICALVGALLLVLIGWMAFWPAYPLVEPRPLPAVAPEEEELDESDHQAMHRHEDRAEETQRLRWHEQPSGPQPLYPPSTPLR